MRSVNGASPLAVGAGRTAPFHHKRRPTPIDARCRCRPPTGSPRRPPCRPRPRRSRTPCPACRGRRCETARSTARRPGERARRVVADDLRHHRDQHREQHERRRETLRHFRSARLPVDQRDQRAQAPARSTSRISTSTGCAGGSRTNGARRKSGILPPDTRPILCSFVTSRHRPSVSSLACHRFVTAGRTLKASPRVTKPRGSHSFVFSWCTVTDVLAVRSAAGCLAECPRARRRGRAEYPRTGLAAPRPRRAVT